MHRLRAAGLSYEQVAEEIGISARQARRLGRRDLRWSIHLARARHAKKADLEVAKAVAVELRARLEAESVRTAIRPSPYRKGESLLLSKLVHPEATRVNMARLADAGLTKREIDAVMRVGVSSDELNELMLRGLDAQRQHDGRPRPSCCLPGSPAVPRQNIATTMEVYTHVMPSLLLDAADAMDRALGAVD